MRKWQTRKRTASLASLLAFAAPARKTYATCHLSCNVAIHANFCSQAVKYLEANGWDMVAASNSYFQDADEASEEAPAAQQAATTGPRTLDGRPAPAAATSSGSSSRPQQKKKGVATLGTLGGGSQHQHDDDDSGDDDHEDDGNRGNLFAGGEKSGLAVQDPTQDGGPRKIISDILAKAKA